MGSSMMGGGYGSRPMYGGGMGMGGMGYGGGFGGYGMGGGMYGGGMYGNQQGRPDFLNKMQMFVYQFCEIA